MIKKLKSLSGIQLLALGFFILIMIGALFLTLPGASADGMRTTFITSLFTATSASCVTGLTMVDTYSHWSLFGQCVILFLIQVGGLGFITIGTFIAMIMRKRIGLKQRGWIKESMNVLELGGTVHLIRVVYKGTLFFEGLGAIILIIRFFPLMGIKDAIFFGIFHSVSAFCNAGFDIMGKYGMSSFSSFYDDPVVIITICTLIFAGGIGFIVWEDIASNKWHLKRYMLQSKMVLVMSAFFVVGGAALFFLLEGNKSFADMDLRAKLLSSLFCAVTPRTAGFNIIEYGTMTEGGKFLTIILMFIGGGSGSTAGGVKMTTVFVLLLHLKATLKRSAGTNIYGRRIENTIVTKASAVVSIYLSLIVTSTLIICGFQGFYLGNTLFEVVSAVCTVGLSTGITRQLHWLSQFVFVLLMYSGRLGSLSFALSLTDRKRIEYLKQPAEHINIG